MRGTLNKTYIVVGVYSVVRKELLQIVSKDPFCSQGSEVECKSFVRFVLVFSDKTATTLKSTVLVVYLEHLMLLTTSAVCWRWLVDDKLTSVGFLATKLETCKESDLSREGKGE